MGKRRAKRIQLRRTKGWKLPQNAVVVARPSKWGNPWRVGDFRDATPENVVEWYRRALLGGILFTETRGRASKNHVTVEDVRAELAGKELGCWCPEGQPCHADVLAEVANS